GNLKTYRDHVVHARSIEGGISIGIKLNDKGIYDVLLSQTALDRAYDLAVSISREIAEAAKLIYGKRSLKALAADAPERASLEAKVGDCQAQFRAYHSQRQSLPPIPEFPSESELLLAAIQSHRETQDMFQHMFRAGRRPSGRMRPPGAMGEEQ